jgi:two-component system, NtrC family, C4-dicarboxylate transport sensor histidine kinase DctB
LPTTAISQSKPNRLRPLKSGPVILLITVVFLSLVVWLTYAWFHSAALQDSERSGKTIVQRLANELLISVEKFEHLPYLVGAEHVLSQALMFPQDTQRLAQANRYLEFAQKRTSVMAVYLMDIEGNTLASSNWNQPSSFVGRNYRFRPYFQTARNGETGRLYAVGATTGEPGYFIAAPVNLGKQVAGVVAVKIDLTVFEDRWRAQDLRIAISDEKGVLFLTTENSWRYRSLYPLSKQVLSLLSQTLQYGQPTPTTLINREGLQPSHRMVSINVGGTPFLFQGQTLDGLGWQLMLFADPASPKAKALLAAELAGMGTALLLLLSALIWQYRRRIAERQASMRERALVVAELEQRIANRTAELTTANDAAVQTAKLALLGQMAAGISHELSQPLTALRTLSNNASQFLERHDAGNAHRNLRLIGELCARMGSIVAELKTFARKEPARLQPIALKNVVSSTLMLIEPIRQASGTRVVSSGIDGHVLGDPIRLEQVLVNLLRNSIDAMQAQTNRHIEISAQTTPDGLVCLSVQDQGPGLSEDVQQHLFEPFFTTKPSGQGLGLGLALSKAIIREMGGRIEAVNTCPGARFNLFLQTVPATKPHARPTD